MRRFVWSWIVVAVCAAAAPVAARPLELARADGLRVRAVETHGLGKVPAAAILSRLGLQPGATFDAARVRRGRADLLGRGDLTAVDIRPLLTGPDSLVVIIALRRAPSFVLSPRGGRAADGRFAGGGRMIARGNAGRGEQLTVDVVQGGEARLGLGWEEPRPWRALALGFRLAGQAARTPEPAESGATFERTEARLAVLVRRGAIRMELEGAIAEERSTVAATLVDAPSGRDRFRGLGLRWRGCDRSTAFSWSEIAFDVALGAWGGSSSWQQASGTAGIRIPLAARCVAGLDLALQQVIGTLPRSHRIHLGNARAPRALPDAAASGDAACTAALAMQLPLNFRDPDAFGRAAMPLALHVFADGGMTWGASAPGALASAARARDARWRWSAGVGGTAWLRGSLPCRIELGLDDEGDMRFIGGIGIAFD